MKIEGYWKAKDSIGGGAITAPGTSEYPTPVANTIDQSIKESFVNKLRQIEASENTEVIYYKGFSYCRICGIQNGSTEYVRDNWTWPEGYLHYIIEHNVSPTDEFYKYVSAPMSKRKRKKYIRKMK